MNNPPVTRFISLKKEHLLVLLGALIAFSADAWSKMLILATLQPGQSIPLVPGVFHITRTHNTGAAFSLLHQHPELLTLISGTLLLAFTAYMLVKKHLTRLEVWAFSLILGGAAGNLADRIRYGAVTDFLDVTLIHYPVFNLADCFILFGIGLLLIAYVQQHRQTPGS